VHEKDYPPEPLLQVARDLLHGMGIATSLSSDYSTLLHIFRNLDYPNHI
jgi:hypothetical protein